MNGKGDKRRPQRVDNNTFESNWDRAFKTETPINISEHWSPNGKRSASVICEAEGFFIELMEKSKVIKIIRKTTEDEAEDCAENWCLGLSE